MFFGYFVFDVGVLWVEFVGLVGGWDGGVVWWEVVVLVVEGVDLDFDIKIYLIEGI